jgi:hypothetical protein
MGGRLKEFCCNLYHRTKCVNLVKYFSILGRTVNAGAYQMTTKGVQKYHTVENTGA